MGWFLLILSVVIFASTTSCASHPDSLQLDFPSVVKNVKNSLVYVEVGTNHPIKKKFGTGFAIARTDELVVIATCHHVVFDTVMDSLTPLVPDTSRILVKFFSSDKPAVAHYIAGRKDRDVALLVVIDTAGLNLPAGVGRTMPANVRDVQEGLDVGFTGYESGIITTEFGKQRFWPMTRRGIVSSVHGIGPSEDQIYLDYFYVDMIVTKGGSGGPIYDAKTGNILGILKGYLPFPGTEASKGLSECVPAWVLVGVWRDFVNATKTRMEQNKK